MNKKKVLVLFTVFAIGLLAVAFAMPLPAEASSIYDWMQSRGCPRNWKYLGNAISRTCSGG